MSTITQKVKDLDRKSSQLTQSAKKFKEKYDKYKGLYETGKKLLDPDTRRATAFKEALNYMLKRAGKALGTDLTKHPYFALNQPAMEALWATLEASDTIDNARKTLHTAEKNLDKVTPKASAFAKKYNRELSTVRSHIRSTLSSQGWIKYLNELNRDRFPHSSRGDAEHEVLHSIEWAGTLLEKLRVTVTPALKTGMLVLEGFASLSASGADIILAEKIYNEKINKLSGSKNIFSSTMGKLEKKRRLEEQALDILNKKPGATRSLQQRTTSALRPAKSCASSWVDLIDRMLTPEILLIGSSGNYLPWELPLPPASRTSSKKLPDFSKAVNSWW